ncbi:hypothetical protein CLIB1423_10S03070 [[Candida] railenensis]|uniref:RNase III domain-containing protein n=1 Tax=[Candida] railenensis TaxID=45579 RepID=A0A9P0QRP5_9ASCO|nr:hypothetical protein CLIB1423_10S03070 [[Candida] railenensis]
MRNLSTSKIRFREVPRTTNEYRAAAPTDVIIPSSTPLEDLLSTAWVRHHLYMIGSDLIRLKLYQKLTHLIDFGGGPLIKNIVFDLSTFLKRELGSASSLSKTPNNVRGINNSESIADQLRELAYFGSNVDGVEESIYTKYNIPDFRWLYITLGYMVMSQPKVRTDEMTDQIIDIYIKSKNAPYLHNGSESKQESDSASILNATKEYYMEVPINYDKLYDTSTTRFITLHETKDYHIELPPLPKLHNRENLVKALIHKELYRALIEPEHTFAKKLLDLNIDLNSPSTKDTLKYELSFLDGLGDLYLARESSNLLYKFRGVPPLNPSGDDTFGTRTYNQLRIILSTNTLLSKLTIAYKLHEGLVDTGVHNLLTTSYVPNMDRWEEDDFEDDDSKRYEQEFLADYFEQYIGALFLEQPEVAHSFISSIYENVLLSISDVHTLITKRKRKYNLSYNYRAWSVDVIGRNIWR